MKKYRILLLVTCFLSLAAISSNADTIHLTDGRELKGIVVEDYKDRLVFSTADGEITLMKADIRDLSYDAEEDNLINLAGQAKERRDYGRAFTCYELACKINPNSKAAKDGLVSLQGYLYRKEEIKKEADVQRREEFERYGSVVPTERSREEVFKVSIQKLKDSIGINLAMKDGSHEIASVEKNSPAYDGGMREGDLLVAIWGRLTGYMPTKEILDSLLEKPSLEIKCTIERTVDVPINPNKGALSSSNDLIGASFSMEFDGLTVSTVKEAGSSFEVGLNTNDVVVAIDGNSTRYMPLKKAVELIRSSKEDSVKLTIRREILIWRKN